MEKSVRIVIFLHRQIYVTPFSKTDTLSKVERCASIEHRLKPQRFRQLCNKLHATCKALPT
jgi:hypothetical protein